MDFEIFSTDKVNIVYMEVIFFDRLEAFQPKVQNIK
jgi:hypothetical protein